MTTDDGAWPHDRGRNELIDAASLLVLTLLGILGFRSSYAGYGFLVAGAAGVILGMALVALAGRLKWDVATVAAATVLTYFVVGASTVRSDALAGILPTLSSAKAMGLVVVEGWKELLTTLRPIGTAGALLSIPYLLGLLSGAVGLATARRLWASLPIVPPIVVLILSILFGSRHATAPVLQGATFAAVAVAWTAVRYRRQRIGGEAQTNGSVARVGTAAALLVAAGALSVIVGPDLPFANAHPREVLRVEPPFNPGIYPSPLSAYRIYSNPSIATSVTNKPLFTVSEPVPAGVNIRFATMDSYNGIAFGVADDTASGTGIVGFAKVGSSVPDTASGVSHTLKITIDSGYTSGTATSDVWVPTPGSLSAISFSGPRASTLSSTLRYDVVNETAISPGGLAPGDVIEETGTTAPILSSNQLLEATPNGSPTLDTSDLQQLSTVAQTWGGGASSPMKAVMNVAGYLHQHGYISHGDDKTDTLAGHSVGRLVTFVQSHEIAGDDEQFASTMALMANILGVPARVVLGVPASVQLPSDGVVEGKDVHAWVELNLAGYGWSELPYTDYENLSNRAHPQPKAIQAEAPTKAVPPPVDALPPGHSQDSVDGNAAAPPGVGSHHSAFRFPGWLIGLAKWVGVPALALILLASLLVGAKLIRFRRRQNRGSPAARVAAGWQEVVDIWTDFGMRADPTNTRNEQAKALDPTLLEPLARTADRSGFGPEEFTESEVHQFWDGLRVAIATLRSGRSRRHRVAAALNPTSLIGRGSRTTAAKQRASLSVPSP